MYALLIYIRKYIICKYNYGVRYRDNLLIKQAHKHTHTQRWLSNSFILFKTVYIHIVLFVYICMYSFRTPPLFQPSRPLHLFWNTYIHISNLYIVVLNIYREGGPIDINCMTLLMFINYNRYENWPPPPQCIYMK